MIGFHDASSALTLLVLLTRAPFLCLSSPNQINPPLNISDPHRDTPPVLLASEDRQREDEERRSLQRGGAEEDEELFKDVDPKTLAAVLLEALNQSQVDRRREREEHGGVGIDVGAETKEVKKEEEHREGRMEGGADRDRDCRQELELLMAAQGKEQEEEERKKAQEEEEKITEKVTSCTMSQTIQVQSDLQPAAGGEKEQGATHQHSLEEEEEQLNPEELKSLGTMMKEFPRLNTATMREGKQNQRESRGHGSYNYVIPLHKGSDLAMSRKKLRWQEVTQKALSFPTFSGNIMDQLEDGNYTGSNAAQTTGEQEVVEDDGPEEDEDKEEQQLSAEEEEARVKAEQEMRRQAAEAQTARMKEEKLADVASDMLLHYMVKHSPGIKKDGSSLSNAVEDKRSEEEQEVMEEEEDIDPQTIDKLIEISSKLHLPADDVVDIISDVEKKKNKDVQPEISSHWQWPSTNGFSAWQVSTNQNSLPVLKRPPAAFSPLKARIQEAPPAKVQDLWSRLSKPLPIKQDLWLKAARAGYPLYCYPAYYQRRPHPQYQPIYFPPPPRPKSHYYIPTSAHTLNSFVGYTVGDPYTVPPKPQYHSWVQPRLRKPPAGLQQNPYYTDYTLTLYPQTFQLIPKPHPPSQAPVISPQKQLYYPPPAPPVARREDSYRARK